MRFWKDKHELYLGWRGPETFAHSHKWRMKSTSKKGKILKPGKMLKKIILWLFDWRMDIIALASLEFSMWVTMTLNPSPKCWDYRLAQSSLVFEVVGIKLQALCMVGNYSTCWAMSPASSCCCFSFLTDDWLQYHKSCRFPNLPTVYGLLFIKPIKQRDCLCKG